MNALELNHVEKHYPGFDLKLDLALPQGCILGLIGENGAGKSTTIRLLLGMARADGGSITVLGKERGLGWYEDKELVGAVLDEPGYPATMTARQIGDVLAGLYPNWDEAAFRGYLTRLDLPEDKKFKDFSRGMKMKLSIAAALSHHAKLLILDEPTSGLDPVVRDQVVEIFSEFTRREDHTVLISSHIVSDLEKLCDYIAFLHKGELLLFEEKDRLLAEYGLLHTTAAALSALDPAAVIGRRSTPYGVTALVRRDAAPAGAALDPVSIEDLFVTMAKEGDA